MNNETSESILEPILGTGGKNKSFTVHLNKRKNAYHVYYGLDLYDVVAVEKQDTRFKLMVAHLRIVGVALKKLSNTFGVDPRTIKRWSDALKSGNAQIL